MLETLWALAAIIIIDVVLGGENAIVIGMAANRLPEDQRKKVIFWGTAGAIAVRFICVAALTYLLMIPGLRLVGGLALIYIAYKLAQGDSNHEVQAANSFWGAVGTVILADAVMGLDNALAIAGAAQGNWWLIIFGLLVSVPIVLYGSTIVSKYMARYPKLVYVGSAILVLVAAQMIYAEPLLKQIF